MKRVILAVLLLCLPALAHPGIGVVADNRGNIFYTDLKQVWLIDAQGRKTVAVPNVHTHELYLDAAGNLYGEHLWYTGPQDGSGKWFHRLWKRTPDGKVVEVRPATVGFRTDYGFVRDAAGNTYLAGANEGDARNFVRQIAPDGRARVLAAGFGQVGWMTVGADGNLYLLDGGSLRRITPTGAVSTLATHLDRHSWTVLTVRPQHYLMGLCADRQGNVYVANYGARQVVKVGADGKITVFARSYYPWSPTGVAITGSKAYILEYAEPFSVRVRAITLK